MTPGCALSSVSVGDAIPVLERIVSQEQISAYAVASGDPNPIHTDEELARAFGFEAPIAHGMLSLAIATEAVAAWAGGYDRVATIGVRFSKPLIRGSRLTVTARVTEIDSDTGLVTLAVDAVSDRGDRVLTNGRAVVRLSTDS